MTAGPIPHSPFNSALNQMPSSQHENMHFVFVPFWPRFTTCSHLCSSSCSVWFQLKLLPNLSLCKLRAFFFELSNTSARLFSSPSSPFQNYQLFPGHLAEAHTVGPRSPPGPRGHLEVHRVAAAQKSSRFSIISTPSFVSSPRTCVLTHSHSSC